MPVNHDAAPAIAGVPFGHQILIVRTELFGVGGTGGRDVTPDRRLADLEGAVDDGGDRRAQRILLHEAPLHIAQFLEVYARLLTRHPFQTDIGAEAKEA